MSDLAEPPATVAGGAPPTPPAPTPQPRRVRKFDRPPAPHDWRWYVGGLGKTLIALGVLMFGFVAYQLWGTGIETARAQDALESEFEALLAGTPPLTAPVTIDSAPAIDSGVDPGPTPTDTSNAVTPTATPDVVAPLTVPVEEGDAIARIEMPAIGVDNIVVAGVAKTDLKKGPGHYPETPMPGQLGNAAIAGHRTTYGQPFFNVDKLQVGDEIAVTTLTGRFVYRVTGQQIVGPQDYQVVATTDPTIATITLTSCHPKYTARERIIITGVLDEAASTGTVGEPVVNYGRPLDALPTEIDPTNTVGAIDSVPGSTPDAAAGAEPPAEAATEPGTDDPTIEATSESAGVGSDVVNEGIADAFSDGWFSDPGANGQVALWGLLLAAVGLLSYLLSRKVKRDWVGLMVGIVPFVIVLYFFFQNVNRLLPPNL